MELLQVRNAIENTPKGANIVIAWERSCDTFKGVSHVITKRVRMVGRVGIEYDNQQKVIAARNDGTLPVENQGLKGMEWVEYPWLIKATKSGKLYVRLYKGTSNKIHPSVSYFMDGVAVSKDSVLQYLTAKERSSNSESTCFTCSVDSILRLHHEEIEESLEVEEEFA